MVVKFPHGKAKAEAKALVVLSTDFMDVVVSEPKKMLPKMTREVISGILDKNHKLKNYLMLDTS